MPKFRCTNYPSLSVASSDGRSFIHFAGGRADVDAAGAARLRAVAKAYPEYGIVEDKGKKTSEPEPELEPESPEPEAPEPDEVEDEPAPDGFDEPTEADAPANEE
jgi:hypothetical protein